MNVNKGIKILKATSLIKNKKIKELNKAIKLNNKRKRKRNSVI